MTPRAPYEVTRLAASEGDEWNRLVEESSAGTPFHRFECLDAFADASDTRVHPLVSFEGEEPVGVFPVFERSYSVVSAVFSPPPNQGIPYLGPVLVDNGDLPRREEERRRWQLVRSCLDHVRSTIGPQYVRGKTTHGYPDPRPFDWEGFDLTSGFTYVVDLTDGGDRLFDRFSRDARSNVRDCEDAGCSIELGGTEAIRRTVEQTRSRLEEQGAVQRVDPSVLEVIYDRLPAGVVRPYVCRMDGDFVGGNVVLASGETVYPWVGAAAPDVDLGVNDAIHWRAMQDGIDRGATSYDLVGADNERLSAYKAKFAPDLEPYYTFRRRRGYMRVVEGVYKHVI